MPDLLQQKLVCNVHQLLDQNIFQKGFLDRRFGPALGSQPGEYLTCSEINPFRVRALDQSSRLCLKNSPNCDTLFTLLAVDGCADSSCMLTACAINTILQCHKHYFSGREVGFERRHMNPVNRNLTAAAGFVSRKSFPSCCKQAAAQSLGC